MAQAMLSDSDCVWTDSDGSSSSWEEVEAWGRSVDLDDTIKTASSCIDKGDINAAVRMTKDICERLGKAFKSDEDHRRLDYSFYLHQCAGLYKRALDHGMALITYYKAILHDKEDQFDLQQHVNISWLLWDELYKWEPDIQKLLKFAWEIQVRTDVQINQHGGPHSIALYVYKDLTINYSLITTKCMLQEPCPVDISNKLLKSTVSWLRCCIFCGFASEVINICKKALKAYPDNAVLLETWALALKDLGEVKLALSKAESALLHTEKTSTLKELISNLKEDIERIPAVEKSKEPDTTFLEGTNINEPLRNRDAVRKLKEGHIKQVRRRPKPRTHLAFSYMDATNWGDLAKERDVTATDSAVWLFNDRGKRKKKRHRKTPRDDIPSKPVHECEMNTVLSDVDDVSIDSDEEFDDSETIRSKLFDLSLEHKTSGETPIVESFYEKSVQAMKTSKTTNHHIKDMILYGADLSPTYVKRCGRRGRECTVYRENAPGDKVQSLLRNDPTRYKKCILHIQYAHKAVCSLVKPEGKLKEIEICGRSKCGKYFTEDEVVVEVLNRHNCQANDTTTNGQVIGMLNRKRFPNIAHPVFICELDEHEQHIMRPLDKTVPKINVFHEKHVQDGIKIQVYKLDSNTGQLMLDKTVEINRAQRHSYVFSVVYILWESLYPLGAVIDVTRSDGSLNCGLNILELQHQVPTNYRGETVQDVQNIMSTTPVTGDHNREDLTDSLSVFTIDPPNSTDLDDAFSVQKLSNDIVEVGVHIADVTSQIPKGSFIDTEAKHRSVTFYQGQGKQAYHMLPEPLSKDRFSLLPNKKRPSLSVFFRFNSSGDLIEEKPVIKKTLVMSRRQFTYNEVQSCLLELADLEGFSDDIKTLFGISKILRKRRLGDSMHRCSLIAGVVTGFVSEAQEAHNLVEEFMILSNKTAAEYVCSKFKRCAVLRCQDAPAATKVQQWMAKYPGITDIIIGLQGYPPLPQHTLKLEHTSRSQTRRYLPLQEKVWLSLKEMTAERNIAEAWQLIGCDEMHPEQALAWNDWISFQEHAEYRCYEPNAGNNLHFTLGVSLYITFTSPIRRYADVVNHRLVHAVIDNEPVPYTKSEIEVICSHLNEVSRRKKVFEDQCKALHIAHSLRNNPVSVNGFIQEATDQTISLYIPGLMRLNKKCRDIPLNLLNVACKPAITKDIEKPVNILTLSWQKRLFSHIGYAPSVRCDEWIRVDPHRYATFLEYSRWVDILKALLTKRNSTALRKVMSAEANYLEDAHVREYVPACTQTINDVSCEIKGGSIPSHSSKFTMSFNHAQIISVQMSAECQRGVLVPYPQIVELTKNVKLCLQHTHDPVNYLVKYATKVANMTEYRDVEDYLDVWLPLVNMESATMAARDTSVVINDLPVKLKDKSGIFSLKMSFCEDRNITFSNMSMDYILNGDEDEENKEDVKYVPSSDFLCIKCPYSKDISQKGSSVGTRMWLAHGQVDKIKKIKATASVEVHFLLHPTSPGLPSQLVNQKHTCSVEIMTKPESNRRPESALRCLEKSTCLAQAICLGKKIPPLNKVRTNLTKRMETDVRGYGLNPNNREQEEAIQSALNSRFTLVQGPPGTGKTYAGVKLIYLFTKLNRELVRQGDTVKQVVFCGPSNKSVDVVAKLTKKTLQDNAPTMIRMYGTSHECLDYPVPGRVLSSRSRRPDNRPDPELHHMALHHLIRQNGKPHATALRSFDAYFRQFRDLSSIKNAAQASEFKEKMKAFKSLVSKAEQEELQHYDVILCTTAMTTNPKFIRATRDRIFQCIIDESGMCTEPESLATIIATKAEQVVMIGDHKQLRPVVMCQHAANMGLGKSLFERYADRAIFLSKQYRMNPEICEFVSSQFYDGNLETRESIVWTNVAFLLSLWTDPMYPHLFCHVEGDEEYLTVPTEEGNEKSCSNQVEVEKVVRVYDHMVKLDGVPPKFINIMSQYSAQCYAIKKALDQRGYLRYNVNTVVSSQGGEWDYVIFSTARSLPDYKIEPSPTKGWCKENLGFITDEHQINVALSRARKGLIIIDISGDIMTGATCGAGDAHSSGTPDLAFGFCEGNQNLLKADNVWKELLRHYQTRGCVVYDREFPPQMSRWNHPSSPYNM